MRILRIALPLLLVIASAACAGSGGAAASAPLPRRAGMYGEVTLLNRDEILRLMEQQYP
jgi:hypothetical protein